MIEATNISKMYQDGEYVFHNLNISIQRGSFTVIEGKSGSGKTTLLNMLATIDPVEHGELYIDGMAIHLLKESQRAKLRMQTTGFIFQSFALLPELSVLENCAIPLLMNGVKRSQSLLEAKSLLRSLIDDEKDSFFYKKPSQLSGGQQQRVAIARALIHNPKVIFADEPTANLDGENSLQVKRILRDLVHQKGVSLVVVTHDSDYLNYADRVYSFEDDPRDFVKSCLKRRDV